MIMWMDNQVTIKQVENEKSSIKSKHIDVKLKFLKDYARKSVVVPKYVATGDMIADLLELPSPTMKKLNEMYGLKFRSME